jgi:DNA-binding response OmpR family regulator
MQEEESRAPTKEKLSLQEGKRRLRILVIDADPPLHDVVTEMFPTHEYEIRFEASNQFKKALFGEGPFRAVVINLLIPDKSFFELLPFVRQRDPQTEIIFISCLENMPPWIGIGCF